MEATATASAIASQTIADLIPHAAASTPIEPPSASSTTAPGMTSPTPSWPRSSSEVALGLIDLGIEHGERVCILANTRPEWSYADLAATSAGAVVVPIYQTNSPEECHLGHLRLRRLRDRLRGRLPAGEDRGDPRQLPNLRTVIVIDRRTVLTRRTTNSPPRSHALERDHARGGSRARTRAGNPSRRSSMHAAPQCARRIRTRSSTPPARPARRRAACSRTATTARSSTWSARASRDRRDDDVIYLYLPLAHSFALLISCRASTSAARSPTSAETPSRSSAS